MKNATQILLTALVALLVFAGCASKQPSPNLCTSVCDGLVAYYPFYGDATDKSGNGLDAKVLGGTLSKDRNGYQNHAYKLNGKNDAMEISNVSNLKLESGSFSVVALVKVNQKSQEWITYSGGQFSKGKIVHGDKYSFNMGYHYYPNGTNNLWFSVGNSSNASTDAHYGRSNPLQYNHIVGVADRAAGKIFLYVNGEHASRAAWNGNIRNPASKWKIGMSGDRTWKELHRGNLDGTIDEVRLYNRALSAEEVEELYLFASAFPPAE